MRKRQEFLQNQDDAKALDQKLLDDMGETNVIALRKQMTTHDPDKVPVRKYAAKYAVIYANEHYDKLRVLDKFMLNLKWTKDDLMRSRATISMMGIPESNITELVDSTR